MEILTSEQLNNIAKSVGYTGGNFSNVGLINNNSNPVNNYSNPNANFYTNTSKTSTANPVSVVSSSAGKNIVDQNTQSIQKIENGYMGPSIVDYLNSIGKSSDINSRANLAKQYGINYDINATGDKSAQQNTQLLQALRNVSSSPASSTMVNDINKAVGSGIGLTQSEKDGLNNLTKIQDELTTAAANARAALDSKDYRSMDYWTAKAEENRKIYEKQLSDYYTSVQDLRTSLVNSMNPTARETELNNKLINIRNEAERFKLQTEKDKLAEYEGQTLGFAQGRAAEIDKKASFKNQEYALEEKNLLLSLGLEQDARKYQQEGIKTQLSYLQDDFELQQKVEDKLNQNEENLFNKANTLADDAKSALSTILNSMDGIDPTKLSPDLIKQLQDLSARSNIPYNLVTDALKAQYNRYIYDRAKSNKPTESEKDSAIVASVNGQLTKATGPDGYTDPNLYARLRASSGISPTEFDNRFGYLVNPLSRVKLGLTTENNTNMETAINWLVNNGGDATDINQLKTDPDFLNYVLSKINSK